MGVREKRKVQILLCVELVGYSELFHVFPSEITDSMGLGNEWAHVSSVKFAHMSKVFQHSCFKKWKHTLIIAQF